MPPLLVERVTDRLTPVTPAERARLLALPPDPVAHDQAMDALPAFHELEGGLLDHQRPQPARPLRIVAWNVERCLFPAASAALLRAQAADVVLLTEMDVGVARTYQRHTIAEVAGALGHGYIYGVEFLELAVMAAPPGLPPAPAENALGFHGNGLTTALPIRRPVLIRLPREADWFIAPRGGQKRIGGRMAVAATLGDGDATFVACSVHLESDSDHAGRARQMDVLLEAIDRYAGGLPVVIGGDLNTNVGPEGLDDPREKLFRHAEARGYDWRASNTAACSTRPSRWSEGARVRRLDWICTRGLRARDPDVVAALDADGQPLSDHELVAATIELPGG